MNLSSQPYLSLFSPRGVCAFYEDYAPSRRHHREHTIWKVEFSLGDSILGIQSELRESSYYTAYLDQNESNHDACMLVKTQ